MPKEAKVLWSHVLALVVSPSTGCFIIARGTRLFNVAFRRQTGHEPAVALVTRRAAVMHSWQKRWPQAVAVRSVGVSRHITHLIKLRRGSSVNLGSVTGVVH